MSTSAILFRGLPLLVVLQWIPPLLSAVDNLNAPVVQDPTDISANYLVSAQWVVFKEPRTMVNVVQSTADCTVLSLAKADELRRNILLTNKRSTASKVEMLKFMDGHTATLTDSRLNLPDSSVPSTVTITVGGVEQEFTTRTFGVEVELSGGSGGDGLVLVRAKAKQTQFMGFKEYLGGDSQKPVPRGFYQPIFDTSESESIFTLDVDKVAVLQFREKRLSSADYRRLGMSLSRFPLGDLQRGVFKMPEPEVSLLLVSLVPLPDAEPIK